MRFDLIEDAYPLSPLQAGLLFHTLFTPEDTVYVEQSLYPLPSGFDPDAFERAWQKAVNRHTALRTSFHWEELDEPIQVVQSSLEIKIDRHDWTSHPKDKLQERMDEFLRADRKLCFDLTSAPIVRLALIRTEPDIWYFSLAFHHILLDRWSAALVIDEVFSLYAAEREGWALSLPPAPAFGAYVEWIQNQDPALAESFWRAALEGFTSPTTLPIERQRSSEHKAKSARTELLWLSEEESDSIRELARGNQVTINTIVQGAWAMLLSRYSGEKNVLFGAVVSGRPPALRDVDRMVGLFINTLPVPARVEPHMSVSTWLKRLQEHLVDVREHDYSSIAQIQSWSAIPSGAPLFETLVNVYNLPKTQTKEARASKETATGSNLRSSNAVSGDHYPLTLQVAPNQRIGMNITYDENRFETEDIKRLLGHLRQLFLGMASNPEAKVSTLPLLTEPERQQILVDWNETKADYPSDKCLHELFEEQALRTPNAPAVLFEDQILTYSELNARANRLAHYLKKQGVGPDVLVGLCVERSLEMVVGLLGILKLGGAYVPIDPSYPAERVAYMIQDAQAPVLLSQTRLVNRLSCPGAKIISLDDAGAFAKESDANPSSGALPDNLAYVVYTSGSTGLPKGAAISHRSAVNHMDWMAKSLNLTSEDRLLQKTACSFDASVWEFWVPLLFGAQLVMALPEGHRDPQYLCQAIQKYSITLLQMVPSMLHMLVEEEDFSLCRTLRRVFCGGEALTHDLQARLYEKLGSSVALVNLYGPTEATIDATSFVCPPDWENTNVPIGRPVANTTAYILDPHLQPVPVGVAGELYIGGVDLARGYLHRQDMTAEMFIPNPFGETSSRLYRTGDLCRYLPEGNIEYLGRIDHQVKVRGFRIELGEIESVLLEHELVREVVVVAKGETGSKLLVAYLSGGEIAVEGLREHLSARLPNYMIPTHFVVLDRLPLSPNGKVDRKALPDPDLGQSVDAGALDPRSPIEAGIAQIWSDVLRLPSVGIHDNFFEKGGHSLLATQVVSRIRSTFQVDLPLRAIFDAPTVEQLARYVLDTRRQGAVNAIPELVAAERGEGLPLSFAQQRLWFIDQLNPGLAAYNIPIHVRLKGPMDRPALERALEEVIRRHEVLRTNFVANGADVKQVVSPDARLPLEYTDLTGLAEDAREPEARRLCIEQMDTPFDLASGWLMNAALIALAQDDHVLAVTMHHIICDGWSIAIFLKELTSIYEAFRQSKPSPLTDLPVQYADFAVWQRNWLQGEELERQASYWRKQLDGAPRLLDLPTDRPREAATTYRGAFEPMTVPAQLCGEIKGLCSEERSSLFMGLLAVFDILLHCYTKMDDIVVGTDEAGRNLRATESLIGFFINHLVLRTDLSGNPSFRDLLRRVRETTLDAYTHSDLPFDKLVSLIQPDREASHTPLFHVLFVMQPLVSASSMQTSLKLSGFGGEATASKYDIVLFVREGGVGLVTSWVFRTDLFDPSTIRAMASDYEAIVRSIVADPDAPLADVKAVLLDLAARRATEEREVRRMANRPRLRPVS